LHGLEEMSCLFQGIFIPFLFFSIISCLVFRGGRVIGRWRLRVAGNVGV
jgi:hypothetical protein